MLKDIPEGKEAKGCTFLPGAAPVLMAWTEKELFAWDAAAIKGEPLEPREAGQLIEQLGSEKYAVRQAATKRLTAAGSLVLPMLAAAKPADPETQSRLELIQQQIRSTAGRYRRIGSLRMGNPILCLDGHPDGVHWAALTGNSTFRPPTHPGPGAGRAGSDPPHPPHARRPAALAFDRAGHLFIGNGNGTMSAYASPLP